MPDVDATSAFIESYRRTFESFDVDAVVACFTYPLQVAGEADAVRVESVPDAGAWRPQIERIVGAYRALGVRTATIERLDVVPVSPGIAHAVVRWALTGTDDRPVYEFTASYLLVDTAGGPRIGAIAHNEGPRLVRALAQLGQGRPA